MPGYLKKPATLLLQHMLQVDPLKRSNLANIREHDWFKQELPDYLFPTQSDVDASIVDTDAIREVCEKCRVSEQEVHRALLSGDPQDQLVIAYNLVIDNKRIADETEKLQIQDFFLASSPPSESFFLKYQAGMLPNSPLKPHPERMPEMHTTPTLEPLLATERKKAAPIKKAKWHLGIRSQSKPQDIMHEVFRAMKTLSYEWKIVNNYHVRVRRKHSSSGKFVKMSLQLYQVDQKSYLLDFKSLNTVAHPDATRVKRMTLRSMGSSDASLDSMDVDSEGDGTTHHILEFFEMCANLITTLAR